VADKRIRPICDELMIFLQGKLECEMFGEEAVARHA
jgi:hypothetical protein